MKALIYQGKTNIELIEKEKPKAKQGTAVLQITASSICGTDIRMYRYGSAKISSGTTIGHECVGEIVDIGSEVLGFSIGDRVQIAPAINPDDDYAKKIGKPNLSPNLKTIGFQYDGAFAEYMEIPDIAFKAGNVTKIADSVADEEAVLAEPIACVLNGQEYLSIKNGDRVAIFGSGFIGCMHAELALMSGASEIYLVEPNKVRLDQAVALNNRIIPINPEKEDPVKSIRKRTDGIGAEVVITACSIGSVQQQAVDLAAISGRISLFGGLPSVSTGFIDSNLVHYKELAIYGVHASTPKQNRTVLDWITEHRLDVRKYISKQFSLGSIMDAFQQLADGEITKAVIFNKQTSN